MEDGKKQKGSSSSFISDLFGTIESQQPSASSGYFASIFPHPSMKEGRKYSSSGATGWPKQPSDDRAWQGKQTTAEYTDISANIESNSTYDKNQSSIFQEQRAEPCHLSSSLYYGGQDIYPSSSSTQNSESYSTYKTSAAEDDHNVNNSESASRGDWWQGSLYY